MKTNRWPEVKELFHAASALNGPERETFIHEACGDDAELRSELESLLEWSEVEESHLDKPAAGLCELLTATLATDQAPERVGPYRILDKIGNGGMGTVFLAERDDGTFEKRVAIKLIQSGLASGQFREHFARERRILARLEHPNITRLLDGGTAPDGRPYLVMEYVDGRCLTEYCRSEKLDVAARLRLFLAICDAVRYAHRNLIVHRDLKPGNILVTAGGVPKLLDFGLARLVHPLAEADFTRSMPWMTPDYASPEQVRGEPVTVASDVYSLGIILYELLTDRKPYKVDSTSPLSAAKSICETEPPPPSTVVRKLRGDLDNVVMRALEKETARRYESVDHFSDDITRYLERRPVRARRVSVAYRFSKFVRRNRVVVSLGAIAALAIGIGVGATIWQAQRAQRAFNDVRTLADTMLFEVHDAIEKLPGATAARELLVRRALEYLDRLSREASGDEKLQRDLAEAYKRIGDVQGESGAPSLGQPKAALASYAKAANFYRQLLDRHPDRYVYRRGLSNCLRQMAMLSDNGKQFELARASVTTLERAPSAPAATDLATARFTMAQIFTTNGDYPGALDQFGRAREQYVAAHQQRNIALCDKRMGAILMRLKRNDESALRYVDALSIDRALVAAHPDDAWARLDLSFDLSDLGLLAHKRGNHSLSLQLTREAVALRKTVSEADPKDARARVSLAHALVRESRELRETGDLAGAKRCAEESLVLGAGNPSVSADAQEELADYYLAAHSTAKACGLFRSARKNYVDRDDIEEVNQKLAANCPAYL